jgi:flavin reductase (DIM6/NTAB) family NADH-FMN oxidoreductase RutF
MDLSLRDDGELMIEPLADPTDPATRADVLSPSADGVAEQEFRAALGRFASGVTIVTTHFDGRDIGMTATGFLSVSLRPPLVLVSVGHGGRLDEALHTTPLWAVSVLGEAQRHVASRFAVSGRPDAGLLLADLAHSRGPITGAALLDGALATLECRTEDLVEAGDHTLVIARVLRTGLPTAHARPLVYFGGRYRHLGDHRRS